MNKLTISPQEKQLNISKEKFNIPFDQAYDILAALKSQHFIQCQIIFPEINNNTSLKFLMSISRIKAKNGVISARGDKKSIEKVKQIMKNLRYHITSQAEDVVIFGITKTQNGDKANSKAPFGYHNYNKVENDQIDEDELLKNQNINLQKQKKVQSCAQKPRACANCSCGRKEAEDVPVSKGELVNSINSGKLVSGCGKCFLGDSFRCATCPYNGMPAFKPGDKLKLVDNSAIVVESAEQAKTTVNNGKIKIEI